MALNEDLLKKLNKAYEPSSMINLHYRSNDIAIQTDEEGRAVRLFIGRLKEDGFIKGDRYTRTIIKDRDGKVIKDYWERKGKAS
jgi:hypothetical protein